MMNWQFNNIGKDQDNRNTLRIVKETKPNADNIYIGVKSTAFMWEIEPGWKTLHTSYWQPSSTYFMDDEWLVYKSISWNMPNGLINNHDDDDDVTILPSKLFSVYKCICVFNFTFMWINCCNYVWRIVSYPLLRFQNECNTCLNTLVTVAHILLVEFFSFKTVQKPKNNI